MYVNRKLYKGSICLNYLRSNAIEFYSFYYKLLILLLASYSFYFITNFNLIGNLPIRRNAICTSALSLLCSYNIINSSSLLMYT